MNNNRNFRRGRNVNAVNNKFRGLVISARRTAKISNAVTPFRVAAKKQMLSIPNHNFQTKIKKTFRVITDTIPNPTTVISVTTADVIAAVQAELGIDPTTTAGELFGIHDVRVYLAGPSTQGTLSTAGSLSLIVTLFDMEETTTNAAGRSSLFQDLSSPAGIAHVNAVYPVNNRPTFSRANQALTLLQYTANQSAAFVVVDMDITYIRTPATIP